MGGIGWSSTIASLEWWGVITAAPPPVIGPMIAAAGFAWWFRGQVYKGKAAATDERLKLANERYAHATEEKDRYQAEVAKLQDQIAARAAPDLLAANSSSVTANTIVFEDAWKQVGTTLSPQAITAHELHPGPENTLARNPAVTRPIRNILWSESPLIKRRDKKD